MTTDFDAVPKRLEQVRLSIRTDSGKELPLRSFWSRLTEDWLKPDRSPGVSYEAVRLYHTIPSDLTNGTKLRLPPIDYLVRVSEKFGYRLEWLATGVGEPLKPPPAEDSSKKDAALEEFLAPLQKFISEFPVTTATYKLILEAHHRYLEGVPNRNYTNRDFSNALQLLLDLLALPLRLWGFHYPGKLSDREINDYFRSSLQALMQIMPDRGHGESTDVLGLIRAQGFRLSYVPNRDKKYKAFIRKIHNDAKSRFKTAAQPTRKRRRPRGKA